MPNVTYESDDESYEKLDESFKSFALDNLYSSDNRSVHTLESSTSCIADDDRDAKDSSPRTLYQMQDKRAMDQLQKVKMQSCDGEDPYSNDMYHDLRESFHPLMEPAFPQNLLKSMMLIQQVLDNQPLPNHLREELIDSIDRTATADTKATLSRDTTVYKATLSRDSAVYTTQTAVSRDDRDSGNGFGGCFCLNIFEGDDDNDSDPDANDASILVENNMNTTGVAGKSTHFYTSYGRRKIPSKKKTKAKTCIELKRARV